ncbi:MAG: alpha/beta hydrolase [Acidobacteria bacterium]|nr:alpha/beta hydrolase [Acidobacteriota bacterium]
MPTTQAADAAIYYETAGSGEPILLIPGFASGIWGWFCQNSLADSLRVVTFDPRGIGRSRSGSAEMSIETFVDDVRAVIDDLGIEKAHILGASFGGFVALEFALRFPERVGKLILACTTAGGAKHVSADFAILRSFTRDPDRPLGEQIRRFFRPAFTEEFNAEHADTVEEVCRLREENEVTEETYSAQLHTAFSFDVDLRLDEITNETLVITGDQDNLVPMQNSENLAAKIPNAKLKVIKNGSHMIFVENASEFNRIVVEFVSESDN